MATAKKSAKKTPAKKVAKKPAVSRATASPVVKALSDIVTLYDFLKHRGAKVD